MHFHAILRGWQLMQIWTMVFAELFNASDMVLMGWWQAEAVFRMLDWAMHGGIVALPVAAAMDPLLEGTREVVAASNINAWTDACTNVAGTALARAISRLLWGGSPSRCTQGA